MESLQNNEANVEAQANGDEMLLADFLLGKLNENRINVTKKEWKEYLDMMGIEID